MRGEILLREEVTAKHVFDAYKQQDALAGRVVEKFAQYLGNALYLCVCGGSRKDRDRRGRVQSRRCTDWADTEVL